MATRQQTPNILDDLMSAAPAGTSKPAATSLRIVEIRRDGGTQPRAGLDETHVQDLVAAIAAGDELPPVDVVFDGTAYWLYDGYHRTEAASRSGRYTVQAIIHQGTQQDAQWMSYGVNRGHGLKRTNEDKKRAILAALKHPNAASMSNVKIAKHCGVDESTVRDYREKLESTSGIPKSDTRTGADGRTINTAKIGTNQPRPQPQRDDAAEDAWRPPGIGARTMQQEASTYQWHATVCLDCGFIRAGGNTCGDCKSSNGRVVYDQAEANRLAERVRQHKGRSLMEVIKTDEEIAAEAQAADIASRNAAADEAARQAQAAAAADIAFGMAPTRTQVLAKLLQDIMDAIPELSKLTGKAGDCILLQSAATKVYGALVAGSQPEPTELPDDLKAHGWQLRQVRGKWIAFVQPEGEEEEIRTNIPREKLVDVIGDARYLDKQLRIGA